MLGTGIPSVGVSEAGVCPPHDAVKLPDLAEEARLTVVGLLSVGTKLGTGVVLDVPQAVGKRAAASASNFLLLGRPLRELDLVGEEHAASHNVDKTELGFDDTQTLLGNGVLGLLSDNFDTEVIVGITIKALEAIGGNLVLPFLLGDRGANIVRVKATVGVLVVQTEDSAVLNVLRLGQGVPSVGSVDRLAVNTEWLSLVLENPDVVFVLVGVESDLLLLATGGIHQGVGVKVTPLGVDVTNRDLAAHHDIGGDILHLLAVEGGLELGAHEAIALAGVDETHKVDGEHGQVDRRRDDNEREGASH